VLRVHHYEAALALSLTAAHERIVVSDSLDLDWDVNQWCIAADVLVTDYSSIYYDYLLLDRPVVHLVPDLAEYGERRGFMVDPLADFGGPAVATQAELLDSLEDALDRPTTEACLRARLNALHNPLEDGSSTQRVGRAVLDLMQRERGS
jgi:CDP-glycerol glycerophosphotransferase (TagB/SpsB family)